jgi:hypothetical protein
MAIECINELIGLKDLCEADATIPAPLFWLDDAQGVDRTVLAQLTKPSNGSGKAFGSEIIESSSRILMADIETMIPKGYTIKSSLNSFCNICTYTALTTPLPETGIVIKNVSTTKNGYLSLDSLSVKIGNTGNYNIVIHDGVEAKFINGDFTTGVEKHFININYKTTEKEIRLYFLEPDVFVYALSCPTQKSCGCSGQTSVNSKDLQVKGLQAGVEFTTQYGFIPCASIVCSMDSIICQIVKQQPRLFALALFYRTTARLYQEVEVTQRLNIFTSFSKDDKKALADEYMSLYYERLNGSGNIKGIADNMAAVLNNINDPCVECQRGTTISWAIG